MAERRIVWTRTADLQFIGILEYWIHRNKSKEYSKKLMGTVQDFTYHISRNPYLWPLTDFPNTRVAKIGVYSLYYKVSDSAIIVTAFWDNRQNPANLGKVIK